MSTVFEYQVKRTSVSFNGDEYTWIDKLKFTNKNRVMQWITWPGRWQRYGDWRWDEKLNKVIVTTQDGGRIETDEAWDVLYAQIVCSNLLK